MECDVCGNHPSAKDAFHCVTCARSAIYSLRVEHVTTLLDKESLGKRVEAAITGSPGGSHDSISLGGILVDASEAAKTTNYERTLAQLDDSRHKVDQILEKATELRRQMEEQSKLLLERRRRVAQRRSDAESATHGLGGREARQLDEQQGGINRVKLRQERDHRETVRSRVYLCREAAQLADLKAIKVRREDGGVRCFWSVGGIEIPDLRNLNSEPVARGKHVQS